MFARDHLCKARCSRRPQGVSARTVVHPSCSAWPNLDCPFATADAEVLVVWWLCLEPCCRFPHSYAKKPTQIWKLIPERGRSCLISASAILLLTLPGSDCPLTPLWEFCILAPAGKMDWRNTFAFLTPGRASSCYSDIPVQGEPSHTQPQAQQKPSDGLTNKQTHF